MGTPAQHKAKAEHHRRFLASISDEFPDWLCTVAFYTAVELIEMALAERNFHSKSHEDRKRFVNLHLQRIFKAYHTLYNASLDVRYEPEEHWPSISEVRDILIGEKLRHIEGFIESRQRSQSP